MGLGIPVGVIYGLAAIFAVLSILFLKGKGSSLFVGHNTVREPAFSEHKLCRALGVCLVIIAVFLLIAALIWDHFPEWFIYIFWVVIVGDILAITIICNLNILFRK